ncbi:MAG TPA: hypothetical protein VF671_06790 [Pseudomonas sp.]|uniref:hypothetical protein n=1 Tax=Pseudomonas sp. TaxID=306 RepID=UPI002EDB1AF0
MEEFNHHLHQLPNFLQNELHAHVGSTHGVSPVQIVARYRAMADHLIATKRGGLDPAHVANVSFMWGNVQSSKADVENMMQLRSMPGHGATDFYSMTVNANFFLQCIRFLTHFRDAMAGLQPRLEEQERQQARLRAEEEARRLAQRQAEEAARLLAQRQAEEAARQLAQRQAEEAEAARQRAKEAALQLAQRQIEEAARALAQRKAEEQALQAAREILEQSRTEAAVVEEAGAGQLQPAEASSNGHSGVREISGPRVTGEVEKAVLELQKDIERAVVTFARVLAAQSTSAASGALSELRYTGT